MTTWKASFQLTNQTTRLVEPRWSTNVFKLGAKSSIEMLLLKPYTPLCPESDAEEELFGRFGGNISSLLYPESDLRHLRDHTATPRVFLVKQKRPFRGNPKWNFLHISDILSLIVTSTWLWWLHLFNKKKITYCVNIFAFDAHGNKWWLSLKYNLWMTFQSLNC